MNIGIIGTGNMGGALGARWAGSGHSVLFGSRDRGKAKAAAARVAQAGDFDEAAAFGDVVLYTVRGIFPSVLLRNPGALAGKIVIDCNNTDLDGDMGPIGVDPSGPTLAERLAADVPDARIVKAFSSVPHRIIELDRETLAPYRISVLLCADDLAAKAKVKGLAARRPVHRGGSDRAVGSARWCPTEPPSRDAAGGRKGSRRPASRRERRPRSTPTADRPTASCDGTPGTIEGRVGALASAESFKNLATPAGRESI